MAKVARLTERDRMFLAGCIEATILHDGKAGDAELKDLDDLTRKLGFDDYEQRLDEFEEAVKGEEAFREAALAVTDSFSRKLILQVVYELSLRSDVPENMHGRMFELLNGLWNPA
jgi:hypothetical protein